MTAAEVLAGTVGFTASGPFGSNLVGRDYVTSGVPVIRGQNMSGRWVSGEFAFVSDEKANQLSSNLAYAGDVVFTQRGTLGQVSLVPTEPYERYVLSQSQMKLAPDPSKADSLFLYYVFSSEGQQGYIRRNAVQSGVPHTNLAFLRSTPIRLPPVDEQRAIAGVLGALDDRIELNRRMNETLDTITEAMYREWFGSEFDGPAPPGWSSRPIGEVVSVRGGSTPRTSEPTFWDGDHAFATPKDLAGLRSPVLLGTERRITAEGVTQTNSGLLPRGTVLLSSRAPIGYLAISEIPVTINQGFIAMVCDGELPNLYVLRWVKSNLDVIVGAANGTTFLEISKRNFRPIPVAIPPRELLDRFMGVAGDLHARVVANLLESRTLAELRDALLPKLISGELRVRELSDSPQ